MDELRDKIEKIIKKHRGTTHHGSVEMDTLSTPNLIKAAQQILALFEEWAKEAGYVKLASDQSVMIYSSDKKIEKIASDVVSKMRYNNWRRIE